ncbi:MAG: Rieske 2Fe-2S domain-containing protein [Blastocatellia bacterium]
MPLQPIAKLNELAVGKSIVFHYPEADDRCLLVRTGEQTFVASVRMHAFCAVVPEPEKKRFFCPCHNGAFDLTTGKPMKPAAVVRCRASRWKFVNDTVYATGVELEHDMKDVYP